jgi:RimK family alpha-L-glutamate ligase
MVALVAHRRTSTNAGLARCRPGLLVLPPVEALRTLAGGDIAIGRLDVSEQLDGIEPGLWELARLEGAGAKVMNRPRALVAAHDKLATSRALGAAGVRHPRTEHVTAPTSHVSIEGPVVVKPRFGSWGRDVVRCEGAGHLASHLPTLAAEPWFHRHGAIVQELVEPRGFDLRLVVAAGAVVGAIERVAPPGEWRTNVALGARRRSTTPPADAIEIALAAADAAEADLIGVDLLPDGDGWTIVELNGAVDFTSDYSLGRDVFAAAGFELARLALGCPRLPVDRTAFGVVPVDRTAFGVVPVDRTAFGVVPEERELAGLAD